VQDVAVNMIGVCVCVLAIKLHSPEKPALIFVSSRRQTRLTALDLIAFLAADDNPKQWLHMPETEVFLAADFILLLAVSSVKAACILFSCDFI